MTSWSNDVIKSLAVVQNNCDVMSFIRCMPNDQYCMILNKHKEKALSHLQSVVEGARHLLFTEQIKDRWNWFMSFAYDMGEYAEWQRWFDTQRINPNAFFLDLKALLDCSHSKKNCLRLWGRANSGKTMVARCISENFVSHFQAMTGQHSDFAHEGFINVSIAMIEEAFFLPKEADDWKSIMGGQSITVNKKYAPKQQILRTPVLMTSNHKNLGRNYLKRIDEAAFETRMFDYHCDVPFTPKMKLTSAGLAAYAARCLSWVQLPPQPEDRMAISLLQKSLKQVVVAGVTPQLAEERSCLLFQGRSGGILLQLQSAREVGRKYRHSDSVTSRSAPTGVTCSTMRMSSKLQDGIPSAKATRFMMSSSGQATSSSSMML